MTADPVAVVLEEWAFLWDRSGNGYCPNCGRAGQMIIHRADGSAYCPECK